MPIAHRSPLVLIPPPFVYVAAFLAGMGADRLFPWHSTWMDSIDGLGWVLAAVGLMLGPGNAILFLIKRTTIIPAGRPSKLITDGAFRFSRNPIYLGFSLIYAGLAVIVGSLWPLVFLPFPILVMNAVVIPMEEANAREAFGENYLLYCRRVRRWL